MQLASRFSSLSATALTQRFVLGWLIVVLSVVALVAYFMHASFEQQRQRSQLEVENLSMLLERDVAANLEKVDLVLRAAIDEYAGLAEKGAVDAAAVDRFLVRQRDRLKPWWRFALPTPRARSSLAPMAERAREPSSMTVTISSNYGPIRRPGC